MYAGNSDYGALEFLGGQHSWRLGATDSGVAKKKYAWDDPSHNFGNKREKEHEKERERKEGKWS